MNGKPARIPVCEPIIPKKAFTYINSCLKTGWVSSQGTFITSFEKKFAHYLNMKFAASTTSGTSALHLALASLGITKDDEVIISTFTMIAPVFAILYVGAKPVFVDCKKDTWNMNIDQIESRITKKTKAIIAVHIYGHPVDMDRLIKIAKKNHLLVIEDAAEALGAQYHNQPVGTFGDIACFSFYANKIITTGEGGMIVTNRPEVYKKIQLLKDMAHSPILRFSHIELGYNYRFSNLQAALGLAQLEEIKKYITLKRTIAKLYLKYLNHIPQLTLPVEMAWAKNIYWMFGILTQSKTQQHLLRKKLEEKGIETRDFFIPMHKQPVLRKLGVIDQRNYPVAYDISERGLYLPSGMTLQSHEIQYICREVEKFYEKM